MAYPPTSPRGTGTHRYGTGAALTARISESPSFNEVGANWYWDGVWKTLGTWADYLRLTGDTTFVSTYFHHDASGPSAWGPYTYTDPLYIGRGIPDTWIAAGQTIAVSNLTSASAASSGTRTYGVSIAVTRPAATRVVTVSITGTPPGGPVYIQLPVFLAAGVNSVSGGSCNSATHTVTGTSGTAQIVITLAS